MSIPEGHPGHCSLCDQRHGLPPWVAPVEAKVAPPKVVESPPSSILPVEWYWKKFGVNGWGAQANDGFACCYASKAHNLMVCVGTIPYYVRVIVSNLTGVSPI
jgi:hypothetical protein